MDRLGAVPHWYRVYAGSVSPSDNRQVLEGCAIKQTNSETTRTDKLVYRDRETGEHRRVVASDVSQCERFNARTCTSELRADNHHGELTDSLS